VNQLIIVFPVDIDSKGKQGSTSDKLWLYKIIPGIVCEVPEIIPQEESVYRVKANCQEHNDQRHFFTPCVDTERENKCPVDIMKHIKPYEYSCNDIGA